jgi:ferric-dicitrate binding protein FerR (iron transport regulator)
LRVAASIILIIGTTVIFYLLNNRNPQLPVSLALNSNDSIITHQLPDNTKVVLNRNSKINYAFNAKAKKREIILSGEAFIEVKHSADTLMIVKTDDVFIRDIGTSFNVKAYPQSNTVEVFVETGEVLFYTSEQNSIRLQKGETGTYDKKLKTFSKLIAEDPNIIAFKTKIFVFNNTKLTDVIAALNNVYPETILLENPELANCTITVSFNDENIGSIVDIIAETLGLQTLSSDTGYIIRGKECIYR